MKNDGSYFLLMQHRDGRFEKYLPDRVFPFEWNEIEFFIHRPYFAGMPFLDAHFWQATNKASGCSLALENIGTIADAKKVAIAKLEEYGVDKVREGMKAVKEVKV